MVLEKEHKSVSQHQKKKIDSFRNKSQVGILFIFLFFLTTTAHKSNVDKL